jgi:hypothetical protein
MAGSASLAHLATGLKAVDNVLSFAKPGGGRPSTKDRSLFVASVALSYAVWENFAEDVVVEAVKCTAQFIAPDSVPDQAKQFIEKDASAWELAVHPGWQQLWVDRVTLRAKGDPDSDRNFGLLTADTKRVHGLGVLGGLDMLCDLTDDQREALDALVGLRGEIVHTGQAPKGFYKADAVHARALVDDVAKQVDATVRAQVFALTGAMPWK